MRAAQVYPLLRKSTSVLCDVFPNAIRHALGVKPRENPKAFALAALAYLRLSTLTGQARQRDAGLACLQWLRNHAVPGYAGLCWGYPFRIRAQGLDTPENTPVVVVSTIAGEAFMLAHRLTGNTAYLEDARSIAAFILADAPYLEQRDGTACFGYTPTDRRRVHNANLHAVAHLYRVYAQTQEPHLLERAEPGLAFSLKGQCGDGSWPYGEHAPDEAFEAGLLAIIDHYHTGFVIRSLHEIAGITGREDVSNARDRGFAYYRDHLFCPDGMPVNAHAHYPVDIHACAEAVLCPSVLSERFPEVIDLATRSLLWTWRNMCNRSTGVVYYRKYPFLTNRLICPRWGIGWMFHALAEYLAHQPAGADSVC